MRRGGRAQKMRPRMGAANDHTLVATDGAREREVDRLFGEQRARDPVGLKIHEALAMVACAGAWLPTTYVEWTALGVCVVCLVRLTGHIHVPGPLLKDWGVRWLMALAGFMLMSRAWTWSGNDWVGDIQALRFAPLVLALYPVLERRRLLILAMVAGVTLGQLVQALDVAGHALGIGAIEFKRAAGRHSGWWDPAVSGSVLTCALGLHVAACATGRGRERLVGGVLGGLTLVSIVFTGTRGAWIAAAVMLGLGALLGAARSARPTRALVIGAGAMLAALGVGAAVVFSGALGVRERLDRGVSEVRAAMERGDYSSDTGMRVAMVRWGLREFAAQPVAGVGAGGYRAWADAHIARKVGAGERELPRPHAHAHNWYLHTLATLGVIGAVLMAGVVIVSVKSGLVWRGVPEHGYGAGPAMAIVGLAVVGVFDTTHVNQQTAALLWVMVAVCVGVRPRALTGEHDGAAGTGGGA